MLTITTCVFCGRTKKNRKRTTWQIKRKEEGKKKEENRQRRGGKKTTNRQPETLCFPSLSVSHLGFLDFVFCCYSGCVFMCDRVFFSALFFTLFNSIPVHNRLHNRHNQSVLLHSLCSTFCFSCVVHSSVHWCHQGSAWDRLATWQEAVATYVICLTFR